MTDRRASETLETLQPRPDEDLVSLGDLVARVGTQGQSAVVLVPAALVASPLSSIFGFSSVCGILIALLAGQMAVGQRKLWLPRRLSAIRVPRRWLERGIAALDAPAQFLDRMTHKRLRFLVSPPLERFMAALACLGGFAMPFLEVVPMSSSIIGSFVALMMLAILTRDGLVAMAAVLPPLLILAWFVF
ncbi:MAG: exopolysaccharide biosynthesis protein [Pseudomonadota bacterium]